MRKYEVKLIGATPLIMHSDNIDWADQMTRWKDDPANKKESKAGDDRTPAWRWVGAAYNDGKFITLPADNIMRSLMEGGAMVPVPGGKNGKTFKSQTQSGMMVGESDWPVFVNGQPIEFDRIKALMTEKDFRVHQQAAEEMGFTLFVKRAKVGTSKHIRVRPRFDQWSAHGTVHVWDEQIGDAVLEDVFRYAGRYKGLGDWRPGGKTPGAFGMFTAEVRRAG